MPCQVKSYPDDSHERTKLGCLVCHHHLACRRLRVTGLPACRNSKIRMARYEISDS